MSQREKIAQLSAARRLRKGEGERPEVAAESELPGFAYAERIAAVSGRLHPKHLLSPNIDERAGAALLSALRPRFVVGRSTDGVRWSIGADRRREVLSALIADESLKSILATELPPTDEVGEMLRQVLRGEVKFQSFTVEQLLCLTASIEALEGLDLPIPEKAEVRRSLAVAERATRKDPLLTHGLIGREAEIQQLRYFVEGPRTRIWEGVLLSGLGGAGKSTLLAKFTEELRVERRATVVVLDFDRPGVDATDTFWLELEAARQVAEQYEEADADLREVRRRAREDQEGLRDGAAQVVLESIADHDRQRSVLEGIRNVLESNPMRPFVLVLDTFEEVTQRGVEAGVRKWLYEVSERLGTIPVKVIFAGRILDKSTAAEWQDIQEITIGELTPNAAEKLLLAHGISAAQAHRLAHSNVLPRRPLELKLLARLVDGLDEAEVEAFEAELRLGTSAAAGGELFRGLVYRRVLLRIHNDITRELACPGLVLRYVTEELIREVLVPALDLRVEDPFIALDELARYQWLVTRKGSEVWHRKDLRRSILKAMIADDKEKVARVHKEAQRYFREQGPELEALYHELMQLDAPGDPERFAGLHQIPSYLGADVADLPPHAAAMVRFATGGKLYTDDVPLLWPANVRAAYDSVGARKTAGRSFASARELRERMRDVLSNHPLGLLNQLARWEVELLFAMGDWDELRRGLISTSDSASSFQQLVETVFPAAVVDRRWANLAGAQLRALKIQPSSLGSADLAHVPRFVAASAHLWVRGALSREVIEAFRDAVPTSSSPAHDLLARMCGHPLFESSHLNVSLSQLPLNGARLESLNAILFTGGEAAAELVGRIVGLRELIERPTVPIRRVLSDAASYAARSAVVSIESRSGTWATRVDLDARWTLLRGTNAHMRDPARYALLAAFPDEGRSVLAALLHQTIPLGLDELRPERIEEAMQNEPETGLEPYIELADRSGVLGELLRSALAQAPAQEKRLRLEQVLAAHDELDAAYRLLITETTHNSDAGARPA